MKEGVYISCQLMRTSVFILIVCCCKLIISCSSNSATKDNLDNTIITAPENKKQNKKVGATDSTLYDKGFLQGIKSYAGSITLKGGYLIVDADTAYFPDDLTKGQTYVFTATHPHKEFVLEVVRTNFTTLQFSYKELLNGQEGTIRKGSAVLAPTFFLASEVDEDDISGDAYGATEYRSETRDAYINIRIGIGKDEQDNLRATVLYGKTTDTEKQFASPTLRAKQTTR